MKIIMEKGILYNPTRSHLTLFFVEPVSHWWHNKPVICFSSQNRFGRCLSKPTSEQIRLHMLSHPNFPLCCLFAFVTHHTSTNKSPIHQEKGKIRMKLKSIKENTGHLPVPTSSMKPHPRSAAHLRTPGRSTCLTQRCYYLSLYCKWLTFHLWRASVLC